MAKIKLTNGTYYYKTVAIYDGVKQINKAKAFSNLCILKEVLDERGVTFQLAFGTLLGAIREKDFINHDEDIDLIIMNDQRQLFFDTLPELKQRGFEVARYDRRGLISIIKESEYIDIYIFQKWKKGILFCSGILYPEELLTETTEINFKGINVRIPLKYHEVLRYEYGDNWQVPVQWSNYNQPTMRRAMSYIREIIKSILPDCIYYPLSQRAEKKQYNHYLLHINQYFEDRNQTT